MNFIADYTALSELQESNRTWKLLRADTAPLILAFLKNVFANETEVPYGTIRAYLVDFLKQLNPDTTQAEFENIVFGKSADLLREWINNGWLSELNNNLTLTDSSQRAIDISNMLMHRTVNTSASHLQIFLHELQQLYVRVGIDKKAQTDQLIQQKKRLEEEIKRIREGRQLPLTEAEKKDKIRTLYDLASRLPQDFRKLEEETREIDHNIRVKMIEENITKGKLLETVLKEEKIQRMTDYGAAYEGFFNMLCDDSIMTSFRTHMDFILSQPVAKYLTKDQAKFLRNLVRTLLEECHRVRDVRERIDENLRMYIESNDFQENRIVTELLNKLEKLGVMLRESTNNLQREYLSVKLECGGIKVTSIDNMRIKKPDEITDYSNVEEHENSSEISNHIIRSLDTVRIKDVRDAVKRTLGNASEMSVAEIISRNQILYGLQEVVTYIRVANEMKAIADDIETEVVEVTDYRNPGKMLRITIPRQIITSQAVRDSEKNF